MLVSSRLRNYEYNPVWGFLVDQSWIDSGRGPGSRRSAISANRMLDAGPSPLVDETG
jgi:hypothetical protein